MRAPRLGWRIFVTCWLIFSLHFASNTVRELYPALSLGDHFSLRVDEYANLHPDLFEKPGYGWHINSNPGKRFIFIGRGADFGIASVVVVFAGFGKREVT